MILAPASRRVLLPSLLLCGMLDANAEVYDGLPPPRSLQSAQTDYTLWLTLSVNGRNDGSVVPVRVQGTHYLLDATVLRRNQIKLAATLSGAQDVTTMPQVTARYDSVQQVLQLQVPDSWLPKQMLSDRQNAPYQAISSPGMLLNYDAYSVKSADTSSYSAIWLEQRFFSASGYLSNTGSWRQYWQANSNNDGREGYLRYDTTWKYSDVDRMLSYQLGDVISNSLSWSNSVRLGGLRISRSFAVRPDLVTYPMLNWSGTAAVPGSVDVFINGYKASSNSLNAGPWTLTSTPYINGAGEATLVTTDALGRQVETSIPFYVSNQLLRSGLSDFDFSAGALRQNYGIHSADYDAAAVSGFYRYGLNDHLTLALQGEGREGLARTGVGADMAVARLGTLSLSASQSQAGGRGQQYSAGYSWYAPSFSLSVSHVQRSSGFSDLSVYNTSATLSRRAEQATLSLAPFGRWAGTFGLGYFDITAHDSTRTRLANLSWSHGLWGSSSLHLTLNKTLGEHGMAAQLQLLVPFDQAGSLSLSSQRDSAGETAQTVSYSRAAPAAGGVGFNLAASQNNDGYQQADLTWKNRYAVLSGGTYGSSGDRTQWFDASGALIWMDGALFASSKINDAFIVVSTSGYSGIPVRYENQLLGNTDSGGHLLVPWVSAWYPAKLTIDPLNLPADINTPLVEQRVSVREASGALVNFPLRKTRPLLVTLVDSQHHPLPPGTLVTETQSGQTTPMGYGGQAWFEDVPEHSVIAVSLLGGQCRHALALTGEQAQFIVGPLVCGMADKSENQK
ncbi:fimbrial assembly protein [Pantoea rwandensis]|uniref:Fimbrial assembly protein n=1 Tax=Pantoea rwandensis TaxID=1076550 RepID=A0A1X1CL70_9GAMM|nr:fimbrial assembly protein [Pantoea rwandensis]